MRRLILLSVLAVCAMVVVPAVAGASHSEGEGPKHEEANGTGFSPSRGLVHVNAKEVESGPEGNFFIRQAEAVGEVTCVNASGGRTIIGGRDFDDNRTFLIFVEDNGEPGRGEDRHNWRQAAPFEVAGPLGCPPDALLGTTASTIVRGNYIVHP